MKRYASIRYSLFGILCMVFSINYVKAQEMNKSMNSEMGNIKMPTPMVPQRPEDISPLLIGENIPVVSLPDASGNTIDLNALVAEKPTILIFYRGGWCPYCSKQLAGLEGISQDLKNKGYQMIAISTDQPSRLMETAQKQDLKYRLVSDADLELAKRFGIAYKAPKVYWDLLPKSTGGKNTELLLPVPSVFILDRKGKIHFEYINPDITQRMKPELLKVVAETIINDL